MFQRILVPLDGSTRAEQALPVAASIARSCDGTLVLLRVVSPVLEITPYPAMAPAPLQPALDTTVEEDAARAYLEGLTSEKEGSLQGVRTELKTEVGQPAANILSTAETDQIDLIVICSHGYTGFKRWLLGSVAEKVAHHSPVPLLLLRRDAHLPDSLSTGQAANGISVLAPLDGSSHAEAALPLAAQLAVCLSPADKGAMHLVRVVVLPGTDQIGQGTRDAITKHAQQYLDAVIDRLRQGQLAGSVAQQLSLSCSVTVDDDIASGIIRIAESGEKAEGRDADGRSEIIAMSTHGFSGNSRWAMGSVAQRVLQATMLPLLIVRPSQ